MSPIYESDMPHAEMEKVAIDEVCGQCGQILTVAWSAEKNCYMLRCGNNLEHNTFTRHRKKTIEEKEGNKLFRRLQGMDSTALTTMTQEKMLQRIDMAKFPQDLTVADKKLLAQIAITYGFDPLMGEVTIYQGRPFVSIDGRYRKAQETDKLDGVESRPATKQERTDWEIPDGDYFYRAEVYVKGSTHAFIGWGRVRVSETKPGSTKPGDTTSTYKPIQANPQRMAEKRAEAQALRKAFHIPIPSVEDIGSPDFDIESTSRIVDTATGEITEPLTELETSPDNTKSKSRATKEKVSSQAIEQEVAKMANIIDTKLVNLAEQVKEKLEKDETPVTAEQLKHITQLLEENKMGATDLGKWMKDQKWTIPLQGMKAIKVWQYEEICEAFQKGG